MVSEKFFNKVFLGFIGFVVLTVLFLFFSFSRSIEIKNAEYVNKNLSENKEIESITNKFISLSNYEFDNSFSSIKDQIELFYIEPRTGSNMVKKRFEIKFKNQNPIKNITEGEKLFLKEKRDGNYEFIDDLSPIFLMVEQIDQRNAKIILEIDLKNLNILNGKEKINESFTVALSENTFNKEEMLGQYCFKVISESKFYGIDEFLRIYNNQKVNERVYRLETDGNLLFVNQEDRLIFKDGKWIKALETVNVMDYPIAVIKNIDDKSLKIDCWDTFSENKISLEISLVGKAQMSIKTDQISSLKKRTQSHISCMLDKQRVVLKEKDVLIKKENRWRLLKREASLEEIKCEEIFYFEKIENKNETNNLIGYFFNPTRTSFQKIEMPILSVENQRRIKKR